MPDFEKLCRIISAFSPPSYSASKQVKIRARRATCNSLSMFKKFAPLDHLFQDVQDPHPSAGNNHIVSHLLQIRLKDGKDLAIRDASGTSDPYVKFKWRGKMLSKSNTVFKNLNPVWDECFEVLVEDVGVPLVVEVYDWDRFAADDFMGSANVELDQLDPGKLSSQCLMLTEEGSEEYMGYLNVDFTITPQTLGDKQSYLKKSMRSGTDASQKKGGKNVQQIWTSVVNVTLLEAYGLHPTDYQRNAPLPDPYAKLKLGSEKYKSKHCLKTLEPKWREQFDMHIFDESHQSLEIMIYDRRQNVFMGRSAIDLAAFEREITHEIHQELEDNAGTVQLLISITGTIGADSVGDINDPHVDDPAQLVLKYSLLQTLKNIKEVGHLTVKVFKAQGLAAADIGGKSDPFCVLELVNARLQTHTEYKTLNPEWNKIFSFSVKDIHNVLEITVYDEDANKKVEFLGKIAIPLLKIRNGEKRWYALKDRKLRRRAKGQLMLELEVIWNPVRASIRTFNPMEEKYVAQDSKFKRQEFMRNVNRVKQFGMEFVEVGQFINSCFNWDSYVRSAIAFLVFMVAVYFFELYMAPLALVLVFLKAYIYRSVSASVFPKTANEPADEYFDSEDDEEIVDEGKEERKSIKEKIQAVNDTLCMVQDTLDYIASLMERVRNTFNFTQPFLSFLAIAVLSGATTVLYFLSLRWLIMLWGINKFTKKLRSPHAIPNNELLDFLSRVPSDTEVRIYGEFRPEAANGVSPYHHAHTHSHGGGGRTGGTSSRKKTN